MSPDSIWTSATRRGLPRDGLLLLCAIPRQTLSLIDQGRLVHSYPVSTSAIGTGCIAESLRTPTGWHAIQERIGAGCPPGAVFRDRQPTGEILPPNAWRGGSADLILTRILWLEGLESGHNRGPGCDSHARYIYLHGTNREDLLGQPASRGCIRLGNLDLVELFDRVADRPAWCLIQDQAP